MALDNRYSGPFIQEGPMQLSITVFVVLLLALGTSYVITRPIGDRRRHIAAILLSLAFGFIAAVTADVLHEALFEPALVISLVAAGIGTAVGVMLAWRARNPEAQPEVATRPRGNSKKKSHYHGLTRA
jgi:hypothetical protein